MDIIIWNCILILLHLHVLGDKQVFERFQSRKIFRWSCALSFNKLCSICRISKLSKFTAHSNIALSTIETQKLAISQKQCQDMLRTCTDGYMR